MKFYNLYIRFVFFILIFLNGYCLFSQEHPSVKSFSPENYGAENQNWDITQTDNQFMYFANNSGLLEFNGSKWTLYPVPDNQINNSIVRSVKAIGDKIYSGSYMDFGVWEYDNYGVLQYQSIPLELGIEIDDDEQFWNIEVVGNWILFQSLSRIYLIDIINNSVKIIESDYEIWNSFDVNGIVYFVKKNKGIYKIINGEVTLFSNSPKLVNSKLVGIFKLNDKLLFITANKGVLSFEDDKISNWKLGEDIDLSKFSIYSSNQLNDDSIVLGTISNGIIHINSDGSFKYSIDFEKGLSNNTVLSLFQDSNYNLWLGLDIGISHINLSSRFRVYNDNSGQIGSVYASIIHDNYLYLGTNQGLFFKPRGFDGPFSFIKGTSGQVWTLKVIDNSLFCGHNKGTLVIENNRIKSKIFNANGSWDFKKIKGTNYILQGNYKGLHILKKTNNQWSYGYKIKGFDISSRFFQIVKDIVYVNHEMRGLYKIKLSTDFKSIIDIESVAEIDKGSGSNIINFTGDYFYTSSKGVYKLESDFSTFKKAEKFFEIFDKYPTTTTLFDVKSSQNMKWCFSGNSILLISPGSLSDKPNVEEIPIKYSNFRNVVMGFENLTKIADNEFLLGSSNGYYILRSDLVNLYDNKIIHINVAQKYPKNDIKQSLDFSSSPTLNNENNSLYFEFSVPHYGNDIEIKYSYKLEGWSNNWSTWSSESSQVFENLPFGEYEFKVKGKVGNYETINQASFSLVIERPWFLSKIALSLYIIILIISSVTIHNFYKIYFKRQQEALLIKSQKEIALSELESSQKLIQLRNEKLEIDIDSKNRELAISTMSLIKKNEFLNTIKTVLQENNSPNQLKKVIKIIDNNINNTDDWKLFKEAFDNADKDFLKIVKEKHPSLTPNDLKLCAYLRLNLSSKEIAPLLNISPRSVEVKRYRLRKKMDLLPKSSLTNYILDI